MLSHTGIINSSELKQTYYLSFNRILYIGLIGIKYGKYFIHISNSKITAEMWFLKVRKKRNKSVFLKIIQVKALRNPSVSKRVERYVKIKYVYTKRSLYSH